MPPSQINLALLFFNLLPIPPLDGSQLLRNVLPYNAVQTYDRIPFWVSWMLMIFVGGYIMRLLLAPAFAWCSFVPERGYERRLQPLQWNEPHFDLSDQTWATNPGLIPESKTECLNPQLHPLARAS